MPRYSSQRRIARRNAPFPRRHGHTMIQAAWRGYRTRRDPFRNPLVRWDRLQQNARIQGVRDAAGDYDWSNYFDTARMSPPRVVSDDYYDRIADDHNYNHASYR